MGNLKPLINSLIYIFKQRLEHQLDIHLFKELAQDLNSILTDKYSAGITGLDRQCKSLNQKEKSEFIKNIAVGIFDQNVDVFTIFIKNYRDFKQHNMNASDWQAYLDGLEFHMLEQLQAPPSPKPVCYLRKRKYTEDKTIRRLDSFSRLFSLNSQYSVCTAVSFVSNEFALSCNLNRATNPETLVGFLNRRYQRLKEIIEYVQTNHIQIYNEDASPSDPNFFSEEFMEIFNHFYEDCAEFGGFFQPEDIFFQAFYKIIASFCLEDESAFNNAEQQIFLNQGLSILLMSSNNEAPLCLSIYKNHGSNQSFLPIPEELAANHQVHQFHAEQLILYYYNHLLNESIEMDGHAKIALGISKYACATCLKIISDQAFFRGSIDKVFKKTAALKHPLQDASLRNDSCEETLFTSSASPIKSTESRQLDVSWTCSTPIQNTSLSSVASPSPMDTPFVTTKKPRLSIFMPNLDLEKSDESDLPASPEPQSGCKRS